MTLVPVDASNEASVITVKHNEQSVLRVLEEARALSVTCLDMTGPGQIASLKAQLVTAQTYAKELRLARGVQLDFAEIVRRFEYELGRSIREGQADGSIATKSELASYAGKKSAAQRLGQSQSLNPLPKPSDFATESELMGARGDGIYALADNGTRDEFEDALAEAKAEGNPSRANVVRKLKEGRGPNVNVITRDMRAEMIRNLADQGYASRQMTEKVGVTEGTIREIARDFDIDIPADRVLRGSRRLDHTQMVENHVTALENSVEALKYIDFNEVEFGQADEWIASLAASISALNGFKKRLAKEATRV